MGRIICVSAFEKTKEKNLFAAHLSTILAEQHKTALIDFEPFNHELETFVAKRHCFNLKNNQNLPVATYLTYKKNLFHDISGQFDYLVSPITNIDMALNADILITIVGDVRIARDLTAQDSEISNKIWNIKKARALKGKNAFEHIIVPLSFVDGEVLSSLQKAAQFMGYKVAPLLKNNEAYIKGLHDGITVLDKNLPCLEKNFGESDFFARRNLKEIFQFIFSLKF